METSHELERQTSTELDYQNKTNPPTLTIWFNLITQNHSTLKVKTFHWTKFVQISSPLCSNTHRHSFKSGWRSIPVRCENSHTFHQCVAGGCSCPFQYPAMSQCTGSITLCLVTDSVVSEIQRATWVSAGFPLFSSDKIPWLFQYFVHFSLTFIKYFYGFYSIFIFLSLQVYMH